MLYDGAAGLQLVEEPQALLGEGQGQVAGSRARPDGKRGAGGRAASGDRGGQSCTEVGG